MTASKDMPPGDQDFDAGTYARDSAKVARDFWGKLKRNFTKLPFAVDLVSVYYCAIDKQTPLQVRAALMAALAYFVVPTDLLPDWIAVLGYSDDAAVLFGAYRLVSNHITEVHRILARDAIERIRSSDGASENGTPA